MDNTYNHYFDDDFAAVIQRFELMWIDNVLEYFDVHELELVIDNYLGKNQYSNAEKAIEFGLNMHPSAISLMVQKAILLIENQHAEKALTLLNNIEQIEKSNQDVLRLKGMALAKTGKIKEAESYIDNALGYDFDDQVEVLHEIANIFEGHEEYHLSIKYLERAMKIDNDIPSILFDLAFCYEKTNENYKSIELYEQYLDFEPFSESAWYNLGISYSKIGLHEKALEAYEFAIAIDPLYASAYFNKANTYANSEKYNESIKVYNEYLEIEPDNTQALCYIGECYENLNEPLKAIKYYKKIIELDENFTDAWYGVASVLYADNNFSEAYNFALKAVAIDPSNADYWFMLANVYGKLQQNDRAMDAYRNVVKLSPKDEIFWLGFSDFVFQSNGYKKAIDILIAAEKQIPDNATIKYRLAALNLINKDKKNALEYLRIALGIDYLRYDELFDYYPQAKSDIKVNKLISQFKK